MSSPFKRPSSPPSSGLKDKPVERTGGGFQKPAAYEKKALAPLEKKSIDEELRINDLHIQEELIGQPLLMRKYTQELARLTKKAKSIKNKLELREAQVYVLLSNDGKGRKVAEVDALVIQDEEVQKLRVELYDAEEAVEDYTGIVRAVAQRLDALKELSWNSRKEIS